MSKNKGTETIAASENIGAGLGTFLDKIKVAHKQRRVAQDPVQAKRMQLEAAHSRVKPTNKRQRANLRGWLPELYRVLERQDLPWPTLKLAEELRDLIERDDSAQIAEEISTLRPEHLHGTYVRDLEARIEGLANIGDDAEVRRMELATALAQIAEKDIRLGRSVKIRVEDEPLLARQTMAVTEQL